MARGRPPRSEGDRLLSLAQYQFLRFSLATDDLGLKKWLRHLPDGAMSDRDSLRFLRHESSIQEQHARCISSYAPGLSHVTAWPWRDLTSPRRDLRLIKKASKKLGAAKNALPSSQRLSSIAEVDSSAWQAGDRLFMMVTAYHLSAGNDFPTQAIAASRLIKSLQPAFAHPVLNAMREELIPLVRGLIGGHPGTLFHVLPTLLQLRERQK